MNNIKELAAVALACDLPEHRLKRGAVVTAVLVHGNGKPFEVEFVDYDRQTVALLTLELAQLCTPPTSPTLGHEVIALEKSSTLRRGSGRNGRD